MMHVNNDDKELFLSLKQGDKKAFDVLFQEYYTALCRFAITFVNDEMTAEEVVQNIFVLLWEKRKSTALPDYVKAYLYKSVYNECIRVRKKNRRTQEVEADYSLLLPEEWSAEDDEKWQEIKLQIFNAIGKLPNKCREIFLLRRQEGLTNQEIADYLGISVKTVENQMTIAISKLRKELQPIMKHLPILLLIVAQ